MKEKRRKQKIKGYWSSKGKIQTKKEKLWVNMVFLQEGDNYQFWGGGTDIVLRLIYSEPYQWVKIFPKCHSWEEDH